MPKTDDETRREIFQMIGAAFPRFPFPEATIALYVSQLEDVPTDVFTRRGSSGIEKSVT